MVYPSRSARCRSSRGFSLVELSIVVAILSVVATLGLEVAANFVNKTATSVSRERLVLVDEAVDRFFKVYGRLPCPAVRQGTAGGLADPSNAGYGLEDCTNSVAIFVGTATAYGNGVYVGAVPFRSLGLPMLFSLDGFNDKLNYAVTANLTKAGGTPSASSPNLTSRFGSSGNATNNLNGLAGIEVRTGALEQPCTTKCQILADPAATPSSGAAYFIFSNGADQRGAVNANGIRQKPCIQLASEKRIDTENCLFGGAHTGMAVTTIPNNVFYDSRYNPGLNVSSYFDDVAIWRTKAQL